MTLASSILTNAPMTPRLTNHRYSYGFPLLVVFKKGYKNKGILAKIIRLTFYE